MLNLLMVDGLFFQPFVPCLFHKFFLASFPAHSFKTSGCPSKLYLMSQWSFGIAAFTACAATDGPDVRENTKPLQRPSET